MTYIRWGRTTCPGLSKTLYIGNILTYNLCIIIRFDGNIKLLSAYGPLEPYCFFLKSIFSHTYSFMLVQQHKTVFRQIQSCPSVTLLGLDTNRQNVDPTRSDPRLPTKSLTRADLTICSICFMSSTFKLPSGNNIQSLNAL